MLMVYALSAMKVLAGTRTFLVDVNLIVVTKLLQESKSVTMVILCPMTVAVQNASWTAKKLAPSAFKYIAMNATLQAGHGGLI